MATWLELATFGSTAQRRQDLKSLFDNALGISMAVSSLPLSGFEGRLRKAANRRCARIPFFPMKSSVMMLSWDKSPS